MAGFNSLLGHVKKWDTTRTHEGDTIKYWKGRNNQFDTAGSNSRTSKLDEATVRIIKFEREGCSREQIAEEFGISKNYVSHIRTGKRWGHVKQ